MSIPSRASIFHDASKKLRADFEDARNNVPHRGSAGGEGERIVSKFLDDHLPQRFRTTNGFVIDKANNVSGQTDIIIYDALNCPVYRTSSTGMIIPSDNAAGVVEVKFNLDSSGLKSDLQKIHKIKNLAKTPLSPQEPEFLLEGTFGVIFAFESKLSDKNIFRTWHSMFDASNPLHKSCNMIVILDRGLYIPVIVLPNGEAGPIDLEGLPKAPPGTKLGLVHLPYGKSTLDHMLRILLGHLTFFRQRIDHPGFDFSSFSSNAMYHIGTYVPNGELVYKPYIS